MGSEGRRVRGRGRDRVREIIVKEVDREMEREEGQREEGWSEKARRGTLTFAVELIVLVETAEACVDCSDESAATGNTSS